MHYGIVRNGRLIQREFTLDSLRLDTQGMDISDIRLVIQWRASCTLPTLWQRWGRAARDQVLQGTAILFAEKEHFDDVREIKHQCQEERKRKATRSQTMETPVKK